MDYDNQYYYDKADFSPKINKLEKNYVSLANEIKKLELRISILEEENKRLYAIVCNNNRLREFTL